MDDDAPAFDAAKLGDHVAPRQGADVGQAQHGGRAAFDALDSQPPVAGIIVRVQTDPAVDLCVGDCRRRKCGAESRSTEVRFGERFIGLQNAAEGPLQPVLARSQSQPFPCAIRRQRACAEGVGSRHRAKNVAFDAAQGKQRQERRDDDGGGEEDRSRDVGGRREDGVMLHVHDRIRRDLRFLSLRRLLLRLLLDRLVTHDSPRALHSR